MKPESRDRETAYDESASRVAIGALFDEDEDDSEGSDRFAEYTSKTRETPRRTRDHTKSPAYVRSKRMATPPEPEAPRPVRGRIERHIETPERPVSEEFEEAETDVYSDFTLRDVLDRFKFGIIGVAFLVLLVFSFLIFRINAINEDLRTLTLQVEAGKTAQEENSSLKIEIQSLNELIDTLKTTNTQLERDLNDALAAATPQTPTTPGDTTQTPTTPTTPGARTYVVQTGDSFWKIAIKFYNDGNRAKDIMTANGYTTEKLTVGDVLNIP